MTRTLGVVLVVVVAAGCLLVFARLALQLAARASW
jgi:hypothetical protein